MGNGVDSMVYCHEHNSTSKVIHMKYIVDVDGTICSLHITPDGKNHYDQAKPFQERIDHFNKLFEEGHEIHYWTARGGNSGIDQTEFSIQQLKEWGVKYTSFSTGKPLYDIWIDDKAVNVEHYFKDKS